MLAEGAWVRQPACGTEDSRCACRATCRRSAHGRHAGTWAALSPFAPGQSPPGRLSRCWPAQHQQDGAAWCSILHYMRSDKWHSLTLFPVHRPFGSALIGLARFDLEPLHLCRVTCNGPMCAQQWQDSTRAEHHCNVSACIVRHVRRGGGLPPLCHQCWAAPSAHAQLWRAGSSWPQQAHPAPQTGLHMGHDIDTTALGTLHKQQVQRASRLVARVWLTSGRS